MFLSLRRQFDRIVQRSKRPYWFRMQTDIEQLDRNSSQVFWRTIGKFGVGNERRKNIPLEVDGRVSRDRQIFYKNGKMLNPVNVTSEIPQHDAEPQLNYDFNSDISYNEVKRAISRAKTGKMPE